MPVKKPDYYAVLGLTNDASDDEIRAAYKKLALQWHPDRHLSGKERAAQRFIDVNTAYHALTGGKESTTTSAPRSKSKQGGTGTARSGSTTKAASQPSSRPSSSSGSEASRRPSARPCNNNRKESHARSDKSSCNGSERMKNRRNASRSHDYLHDPHEPSGRESPAPSDFTFVTHPRPEQQSRRADEPVIPPSSNRLHKVSRLGLADDFIQKLSKGSARRKNHQEFMPHADDIPLFGSPLRAMRSPRGVSKEWLFPLPLTLEEIFHGSRHRFLVRRELLSRRVEQVEISVHVPAGTRPGTRIVCPRAGHQRKDGTFQDVVFLVEDELDQRFSRVNDDLYLDIYVPWQDSLVDRGGEICIEGLDGEEIVFALPYPIYDQCTEGKVFVKGAGMPIRQGHKVVGRGDMIIRYASRSCF
ncbi:hypothetical protein ID866_4600 [Astraeus odoratus]|nr:hypothetical protein ID866_4600 [Astraeus odoratus]